MAPSKKQISATRGIADAVGKLARRFLGGDTVRANTHLSPSTRDVRNTEPDFNQP